MAYRSNNSKKEGPYCDHCKLGGHIKDSCFKLIGYPEWDYCCCSQYTDITTGSRSLSSNAASKLDSFIN
ncbi:hypothetical protein MANES_13G093290v8 [Manihot esculenta]|uniref:Uncharacterized protein n=1 Tax=Manihot esculenta TaxID=3983 RepID=A0A2C9UQI0_MANES|nr:hypothetical protein MANES_13G093290v8 [Manihot esculenta]